MAINWDSEPTSGIKWNDKPTFDHSMAGLASSQSALERFSQEADVARANAAAVSSPMGIAKETAKGTLGSLANGALKFVGSAIKAPIDLFNQATGHGPDTSANVPGFGGNQQTIQGEFASKTAPAVAAGQMPPLVGTLSPVGQTIMGAADVLGSKGLVQGAKDVAKATVKPVSKLITSYAEKRAEKKALNDAIEVTKPVLNKKDTISSFKDAARNGTSKGYKVEPSSRDLEVANSVKGIVSKKQAPLDNARAIYQKIADISETEIRPALQNPGGTPIRINPISDEAPGWSPVVQRLTQVERPDFIKADPVLDKTYDLTRQRLVEEIQKQPPTLEGLWDARIAFDNIAERQLGNLDPGSNEANVIKRAVLDTRRALNDYIADTAPNGDVLFRQNLKDLSHMYEAVDNIAEQNRLLLNKTWLTRYMKQNPGKAKSVGALLGVLGLGTAGGIAGAALKD
jgi:hypothetical protein